MHQCLQASRCLNNSSFMTFMILKIWVSDGLLNQCWNCVTARERSCFVFSWHCCVYGTVCNRFVFIFWSQWIVDRWIDWCPLASRWGLWPWPEHSGKSNVVHISGAASPSPRWRRGKQLLNSSPVDFHEKALEANTFANPAHVEVTSSFENESIAGKIPCQH